MRPALLATALISLLVLPASAADVSLRSVLLCPNVSSSTGEGSTDCPSVQLTFTAGKDFDDFYGYFGVFANYDETTSEFTEVDPFVGMSFVAPGDLQVGISATLVHNLERPVSLAGNLVFSHTFKLNKEVSLTPRAAWMPQFVFDGQSGHYIEGGGRLEWRPTEWTQFKFVFDSSVVYDTGAYGTPDGISFHLEPKVRWRAVSWLDLETGPEFHWSKSGELNPAFLLGLTISFSP